MFNDFPEDEEEYGLIEPFHVDNGEVDGMTNQQIFVLGYEFATVVEKLNTENFPFEVRFHSENENRIRKMLDRHKAAYEIFAHDDYPLLVVHGASSI